RDQETKKGKPKNELLVSRIESISLASVESFFTDERPLPPFEEAAWWEVWVRPEFLEDTLLTMQEFGIRSKQQVIRFPERVVLLALADVDLLGRLITHTAGLAELRLAQDTPAFLMETSNLENAEWVDGLAQRTTLAADGPAICILDSGIT